MTVEKKPLVNFLGLRFDQIKLSSSNSAAGQMSYPLEDCTPI